MPWLNQPATWTETGDTITVVTDPNTDFWRTTHYGFVRDNGHFLWQQVAGDFVADVKVIGAYTSQYDQAGLMIRAGETTWIKCGIEFVDGVQYASAVVTREYSDWSVLPLGETPMAVWIRATCTGGDVELHYSLDGTDYRMLRMAHLTAAESLQVGPMCASPEGSGFEVRFEALHIVAPTRTP